MKSTPNGKSDLQTVADELLEEKLSQCNSCHQHKVSEFQGTCDVCAERFGPHICKAIRDPFDYVVGLRSGAVIHFTGEDVKIVGEWIVIKGVEEETSKSKLFPFPCPRGVQIRLSEIAWFADAPMGS